MKLKIGMVVVFAFVACDQLNAQVDSLKMSLDFRTRGELDNGVKTLINKDKNAEATIFSRARFGLDYYYQNLEIFFSAQDVRIWGELSSSATKNQNFILHEAWVKYLFTKNVALKIGRQALVYDNERLLGGVDWTMQGRSFDAVKGIFNLSPSSKMEAVVTYNNDDNDANDTESREIYTISEAGETTKSMQVLHYEYKGVGKSRFSAIVLNNVLQSQSGLHYDMFTVGINTSKYFRRFGIFGSIYYQGGKNTQAQRKSAYQISVNNHFIFNPSFDMIVGTEWLSGASFDTPIDQNRSFSPLYGTNHAFNGFMDYFYAGTYFNSFGLNDYYLKMMTKLSSRVALATNVHSFTSNGKLAARENGKQPSSYLGTELDLVLNKRFGKLFTLTVGHSFMFAGRSMRYIKNVSEPKEMQSWSWIGLKFNPSFDLL
ncbi:MULTISPECIES: alginate export family protein [Sphingobacterium]|uniref:alginate export family protein n=1 Tax=Sphingobacterium TaxID=28453 RepID=UPI0013DBECB9|nr:MULTISPECIES: alginate export family protein [unclassified Sphingobacterium]